MNGEGCAPPIICCAQDTVGLEPPLLLCENLHFLWPNLPTRQLRGRGVWCTWRPYIDNNIRLLSNKRIYNSDKLIDKKIL